MANIACTKDTIKKNTIRDMRELGFYHKEFDPIIDVYSGMMSQYIRLLRLIKEEDYVIRSESVISVENLRKDIMRYASELGLTTQGHKKLTGEKAARPKLSKLEKALEKLG